MNLVVIPVSLPESLGSKLQKRIGAAMVDIHWEDTYWEEGDKFSEAEDRRRRALINEIFSAFRRWKKSPAVQRECQRPWDEELEELYPYLADKEWNYLDFPRFHKNGNWILIPLFTDHVFAYFLPSMLIAALTTSEDYIGYVISRMMRRFNGEDRLLLDHPDVSLTPEQKTCLINTLNFFRRWFPGVAGRYNVVGKKDIDRIVKGIPRKQHEKRTSVLNPVRREPDLQLSFNNAATHQLAREGAEDALGPVHF
jgi:hypothetical protein